MQSISCEHRHKQKNSKNNTRGNIEKIICSLMPYFSHDYFYQAGQAGRVLFSAAVGAIVPAVVRAVAKPTRSRNAIF